jgi:hypothetical protein
MIKADLQKLDEIRNQEQLAELDNKDKFSKSRSFFFNRKALKKFVKDKKGLYFVPKEVEVSHYNCACPSKGNF